MRHGLADKRVLVTGAGRNIGLAIVRSFAESGAHVVLNDRTPNDVALGLAALGNLACRVRGYPADVRNETEVGAMLQYVTAAFGGLDVCVCNAGIYPSRLVLEMEAAEWDQVMEVNARGAFLVAREAARCMVRQGIGGHIITISSGSYQVGRVGAAHYCASKAAVVMLTRVLAMELAPYRIQVNSIAPGIIESEHLSPEYKEAFVRQVPWGRIGRPEDVAAACIMLVASDCEYLTGQVISVDGGATAGRYGLPP